MANNTRPTANKRAREKARIDRQKEKEQRRAEARERRASMPIVRTGDEDPDIAGIRPGPQPPPEWLDLDPEAEADTNTSE